MTVAVVTDSAASLPPEVAERHGITVVPLTIVLGGVEHHDGVLPIDEVLARLDEGVSTSGASPGEFTDAARRRLEDGDADAVLLVTIASEMSATYTSAVIAAEDFGGRVAVVDTETAAGAEGLVALAAARAAAAGRSLAEVEEVAHRVADEVRLVATIGSFDQLVRSGRVPGIAGWAGRYLGVHPLFEFGGNRVRPRRPAFSREAALDRIVQACRNEGADGGRLHCVGLHAADEATARHLLGAATEGQDVAEAFIGSFSPVMVAHTGPGLAGLAWWWENV